MDLKTTEWEGMKWINVDKDGDMLWILNTVINSLVPLNAGNFLAGSWTISFCKDLTYLLMYSMEQSPS